MNIDNMTNLFQTTKTLRFRLIPQGKTMETIERDHILTDDSTRAEEYVVAKRIIDEYHKCYIEHKLSGFAFGDAVLSDCADAYYAGDGDALADKQQLMMKQLSKYLKDDPEYKQLFGKELFTQLLPAFASDDSDKQVIEHFRTFSTYFTGFYENRKNMYTGEGKSTEIANRIVRQNLVLFLDDITVWKRVLSALPKEEIEQADRDFCELIGLTGEEIFRVSSFDRFLAQSGIDAFNTYIGGYTNGDGSKVKGINERINLYNQNTKGSVPKLKPLYKQILSDRETVSYIPDAFSSDEELLVALRDFCSDLEPSLAAAERALCSLRSYDTGHVYVSAGGGSSELSALAFGSWRTVDDGRKRLYEREHPYPADPDKAEKYLETQEKDLKRAGSYSLDEIERAGKEAPTASEETCPAPLAQIISDHIRELADHIKDSRARAAELMTEPYPADKKLSTDDGAILRIKQLLDDWKAFWRFCEFFLGSGDESEKDPLFYGDIEEPFRALKQIDRLYDKVRNYLTKKPFSTEKIKLTFGRSDFFSGWAQPTEWGKQESHLFGKDGKYYLFVTSRTLKEEWKRIYSPDDRDEAVHYRYLFQKPDNKNTPRLFIRSKGEGYAPAVEKYHLPVDEVIDFYDARTFTTEYREKDPELYKKSLTAVIDYFKLGFSRHESYKDFQFQWKKTEDYADIAEFYKDTVNSCYRITAEPVNFNGLLSLVEDGCGYLFEVYSKDFSEHSHGTPNLHTLYFKMLFDEHSAGDVRLMGNAEIFYRAPSLKKENTAVHPANTPVKNKNPLNEKAESCFAYELVKDRRYTRPHFELHFPIMLNAKCGTAYSLNAGVRAELAKPEPHYIIGIDRGERNLIYVSVIDSDGRIVEQESLNCIDNRVNGQQIRTDYHALLDQKSADRQAQRREWKTIENIKDLKEGYISQAVFRICQLVIKYNAIVVMENLNAGFKNARSAVEKSVYQKFEKMLCDKLSFLARKDVAPDAEGGVLHAYQLALPKANYSDLKGQNGILFYIPAWLTSKIDPVTGFADLLKVKYENTEQSRQFFGQFDAIEYNADEDLFEFWLDYTKFRRTEADFRKKWIVCTNGDRIRAFRNSDKKNSWDHETVVLTPAFKKLFEEYGIAYCADGLRDRITAQTAKPFFERLTKLLALTLQMRNSITGTDVDYLISPVRDENGDFYDSRKGDPALPLDADANGAYNIARKGLWIVRKLQKAEDPAKENLAIKNADWLRFAQER